VSGWSLGEGMDVNPASTTIIVDLHRRRGPLGSSFGLCSNPPVVGRAGDCGRVVDGATIEGGCGM